MPSSCMNCPHFDPSWPTSHVTLTLTLTGDDAKFMNCQHFHSSQPTSNTMLTVGGDAKFMHELSTLWPVMAHLPCDTDADTDRGWCQVHELSTLSLITAYLQHNADSRRRCQVHAWTVHTLTHHGLPLTWRWWEGWGGGGVGGKVVNCPHFNPSQPTSSTTVTGGGDAKFMHELSTLWPIMAYLPHNADWRRTQIRELSTHELLSTAGFFLTLCGICHFFSDHHFQPSTRCGWHF